MTEVTAAAVRGPFPAEPSRIVEAPDGVGIAVYEAGTAESPKPPFVLVHGATADHTTFRAVARYDRLAEVGRIRCPVLVVAGDEDAAMGVPTAAELRDRIPEASLVVLRGAGHTIHIERPSTFAHLVSDFMAFDGRPPAPGR